MGQYLFQQEVASGFENCHFEIRGWKKSTAQKAFNKFLSQTNTSRLSSSLKTENIRVEDGVAFVQLKGDHGSSFAPKEVKRLCRAMADPANRHLINKLTNRSLLGISPVNRDTKRSWNKTVFEAALDHGPQYLQDLNLKHCDHIPDWALVLAFAMVAGINIFGYPKPSKSQHRSTSKERSDKITQIFGYSGVSAAGSFLDRLVHGSVAAPDLQTLRDDYYEEMNDLEKGLQDIFDHIKALRSAAREREDNLGSYCNQARDACFSACVHAAQTLLAHSDMLNVYLEACKTETSEANVLRTAAAASSLAGTALSCQVASAPLSFGAVGTFLTTWSWPTVLTLTNPAGLAVGGAGLFIVALSMFKESLRKGDILRYQNMTILLMRSCDAVNEARILAGCFDSWNLNDSHHAERYLEQAGNQAVIQLWKEFAEQQKRDGVKIDDGRSRKRQLSRFLKTSTKRHETELRATLKKLKSTGSLEPLAPSDSSGDETD